MSSSGRNTLIVFPGQGSQYPGMGSDLYEEFSVARQVYDEAADVLGYDIKELSFSDPQGQIGRTRYTQPVLLTHQIACLRVFEELSGGVVEASMAGGHSLGEYTALVAAGCLSFEDGLKLVNRRGELMGEHGEGGMLALALDVNAARQVADKHYCQVASMNLPEQTVVGGRDEDLEKLAADMKENMPRKRATPLATEGAFHTYLMVAAAREFRSELDAAHFEVPRMEVLSNSMGQFHEHDADGIKARLFFQLFGAVNWVGCLRTALEAGANTIVEFGGGIGKGETPAEKRPNLDGIVRKTLKATGHDAEYFGAINSESIKATAAALA